MVIDGLSRSFAAVLGDSGTYTSGKEIGNAVEMSFEPGESKDNPLYANNTIVESDSSVASAKVTITNDGISLENLAFLLGVTLDTVTLTGATTTAIKEMMLDGANPPYMGYGIQGQTSVLGNMISGAVNAIGTMINGKSTPANIVLQTRDGQTMARWLISDLRSIGKSSPEVVSDAL